MDIRKSFFLLFLIFLIFLGSIFLFPIFSYQEARRVVIIQEAFLNHSLIPTFNGEPYFTKPPLYTWLGLIFFSFGKIFGLEVAFLRIFSILCYLLTAYLLYLILKKDLKRTLLTLFILFSSFRFLSFIYRIDLEPLFIFFTTLSFYFLIKFIENPSSMKAFYFYFCFALAFLVRGPLHFFLLPALLFYGIFFKEKKFFKLLFYLPGWLFLLFVILPWYLYGYLKYGGSIFQEFFYIDIWKRMYEKTDPFYYYFEVSFLNFFPSFILISIKFKNFIKFMKTSTNPEIKLYLISFLIPLILLSFTGEKFDKYLLFLYPFLSLFLSEVLLNLYSKTFLFRFFAFLMMINFFAILGIQFSQFEEVKFKTKFLAENLPKHEKYSFYMEVNPYILYLLQKPVPVIKSEKDLSKILEQGYFILSPFKIKNFIPKAIYPDPYKKNKFWYLYRLPLSPK